MGSFVVVVMAPAVNDLSGVMKIPKPVLVQAIVAECSIETFDEGVLGWLAGLNKMQGRTGFLAKFGK
jgi:hypothetical protein